MMVLKRELSSSSYIEEENQKCNGNFCCRICHDEEDIESCKKLEAPCACSGTVKFAHRDCIQRWCNEKGNTVCEICLQKFEPGYTATPPKKRDSSVQEDDEGGVLVNIRGRRVEIPRRGGNEGNPEFIIITTSSDTTLLDDNPNAEFSQEEECSSSTSDATASCCRTVALILTALLLTRHLVAVIVGGEADHGHYPFSLPTVLALRALGILVPMFLIIQTISAIQSSIRRRRRFNDSVEVVFRYTADQEDHEQQLLHTA